MGRRIEGWTENRRAPYLFMMPLRLGASDNARLPVGVFDSRGRLLTAEPDRAEARRYMDEITAAALGKPLRPRPFRRGKIDHDRRHIALSVLLPFGRK